MNHLTRRQLGIHLGTIATGAAISAAAVAQTPTVPAQTAPDWLAEAVQSKSAAASDLMKFELDMATEPAFRFKA
ncbi:MAG TPA: hypothetical protein VG273_28745 [Bryobacteraceae bacterium]|jgi:hypothetical protein|nr:hypothetical protein [Bryobacteraceae bacterium]